MCFLAKVKRKEFIMAIYAMNKSQVAQVEKIIEEVVNDPFMADHLVKLALKRAGKGVAVQMLSVERDGKTTPLQHSVAYSFIVPILEELNVVGPAWFPTSADGAMGHADRFTKAILMLRLTDISALGLVYDVKNHKPKTIWRINEEFEKDSFWVAVSDTEVGNLVTAKKVNKETFKSMVMSKGGWAYTGEYATSSAGELKQGVLQLPGKYYGPGPVAIDWDAVYELWCVEYLQCSA